MGEAKRRKQRDANYGKDSQPSTRYVLAPTPPITNNEARYEAHAIKVVRDYQAALVENAQRVRNRLRYSHKEADLCLMATRAHDSPEQVAITFVRIEESKRYMKQQLKRTIGGVEEVDSLFRHTLSQCKANEFLWTHTDTTDTGVLTRLLPIADAALTSICRLHKATVEAAE